MHYIDNKGHKSELKTTGIIKAIIRSVNPILVIYDIEVGHTHTTHIQVHKHTYPHVNDFKKPQVGVCQV